ncbi:MAG: glycosyltransferase [Rhizobiales bacterium]|nr:glycosyltransferase [Hyphomicrobiales bacterium]
MKLAVVYGETPAPPNHGGRLDVYQRLLALKEAGARISLVCWRNPKAGETEDGIRASLKGLVDEVHVFDITTHFERPWLLLRYPGWVSRRALARADLNRLVGAMRAFAPDAILIDGLPSAVAGLQLAGALKQRYFFRSANREFKYVSDQYRLNTNWRGRLRSALDMTGLERFERGVIGGSVKYYDCSQIDLAYWTSEGYPNGAWLPPVLDRHHAARLSDVADWQPSYDVGYLGNLVNLNNVQGVLWFVETVVPILRSAEPGLRIRIAGSRPVDPVIEACRKAGVDLLANPPQAADVLRDCRVLVNPVFQGSGVNLKSIEMLHTPAGLVSTTVGVTGMPQESFGHFEIADTPEAFARGILAKLAIGLDGLAAQSRDRAAARSLFAPEFTASMLRDMTPDRMP